MPLQPGDPSEVGQYALLGLLGRGGMGSVYLGRSPAGQLVAVKVVRAELAVDQSFLRLFDREARMARRVARFSTAEVLDVGSDGGRPFMVTEYVDGPTLWEAVDRHGPLDGARLERVAIAVATALTAIHGAGMVHRDLKPSNVMLSSAGPLVIDFGIAHALDGTTYITRDSLGTPAFMAPEQASGEPVGPAADVFAWGGVVVYAATGQAPFGSGRPEALLFRVVHQAPKIEGVPEPLRSVVAEAMRGDPEKRPTAAQLYARLLATAATPEPPSSGTAALPLRDPPLHRPASSHPPASPLHQPARVGSVAVPPAPQHASPPEPASPGPNAHPSPGQDGNPHSPRRRRIGELVGSGKLLLPLSTVVALAIAGSLLVFLPRDRGGSDAVPGLDVASPPVAAEAASRRVAAAAYLARTDHPELARRLAVTAYRLAPTPEAEASVYRAFAGGDRPTATLTGHTDSVYRVAFSPDSGLLATSSWDGTARVWDAGSNGTVNDPLATFVGHGQGNAVLGVAFSPDGRLLVTCGADGATRLWDVTSRGTVGAALATFTAHTNSVNGVGFSPDGRLLATSDGDGVMRLWDATARGLVEAPLAAFAAPASYVNGVGFSPDGRLLATRSEDGTARLWDVSLRGAVNEPLTTFTADGRAVYVVEFSPDGSLVVTRSNDGMARLWDVTSHGTVTQPVATFAGHPDTVYGAAFSPDGSVVATSSDDGSTRVWDAAARGFVETPLATYSGHTAAANGVTFTPDGHLLVTRSDDGTARLWDATSRGATGEPLAAFTGDTEGLSGAVFSPDGRLLATGSWDDTARLWDLDANRLVAKACGEAANQISADEWATYVPELAYDPPCD